MNKPGKIIFFGAHPDDESFGQGATLALYASRGAKVIYVCSTRGELGTVNPELMKNYDSIGDLRWHELECAARELGLADIIYLGYRDSGVSGSENNKHPDALASAPIEQVAGRMVKIIREIKPDVVITHDAGGGYLHPDHTATHYAVLKAFYAAGDPQQYPQAGPIFQPQKLYIGVGRHGFARLIIRLIPLTGRDPHHFGRNRDVDMTKMMRIDYPIHAVIHPDKQALAMRDKAAACHVSQNEGRPGHGSVIFWIADIFRRQNDYFMREYPPPGRHIEKDLFEKLS